MFNRDKITENHYRYLAAFIVICIGIFVLIEHESVTRFVDGQTNKIMGWETPSNCESTSFWDKYDLWGDTSTLYAPSSQDETTQQVGQEKINCEETSKLME